MDLTPWLGSHSGVWRTWLRPGELHDESDIELAVARTPSGWSLTYQATIADDPVTGEMLVSDIGDSIEWTDSWHTANERQHLTADGGPPSYLYGPDDAPWRWSIDLDPTPSVLTIRHMNQPPGHDAVLAVEMVLPR